MGLSYAKWLCDIVNFLDYFISCPLNNCKQHVLYNFIIESSRNEVTPRNLWSIVNAIRVPQVNRR